MTATDRRTDAIGRLSRIAAEAEQDPDFAALPDWAKAAVLAPVLADLFRSHSDSLQGPTYGHHHCKSQPATATVTPPPATKARASWVRRILRGGDHGEPTIKIGEVL